MMQDTRFTLTTESSDPLWAQFDPAFYGRHDAAAAQAVRAGAEIAIADYFERGERLGYGPNILFDPAHYLAAYPDVAAEVASGRLSSAFAHFASSGWLDLSPHWLFDVGHYRRLHPDLTSSAVGGCGGLYNHFLMYGQHEGRLGHSLFDGAYYLARLPADAIPEATANPFRHYLRNARVGCVEVCGTPYFDPAWYLASYGDVGPQILDGLFQSALHHYLARGRSMGRDPLCDFSEADYRRANPDVDAAVQNGAFRSGYDHFLNFGVSDPRSPSQSIDLPYYRDLPAVVHDMAQGKFPNVFAHLLQCGLKKGLPLKPPVSPDYAIEELAARSAFVAQAQRALLSYGRAPLDFTIDGPPDVCVIVIVRNHFALTMQALGSLRSTFPGGIELIVVDNGSVDETRDIGDLVHGARIIHLSDNIGFLRGCNLALQHATAPAVLYLNNDVIVHAHALRRALDRLGSHPSIGAVGGKIIRSHGMLQEAGCFIWRDGNCEGWMRDASPAAPEANYVRDVDFCSGCFLLVRHDLLKRLDGFDEVFAPAYFEETDLCLRIQGAGFRIVYDPEVSLTHLEYASARSVRAAVDMMVTNRSVLRDRHAMTLRRRPIDRASKAEAAAFASRGRRVLFIEDTIPIARLGSGYGRSADVLSAIVAAGWQATVFPMVPVRTPLYWIKAALPETVELLWDRNITMLAAFLTERHGYYDMIWVSRAHNLRHLATIMNTSPGVLGDARVILDTEAVFSIRDAAKARLDGLPFDFKAALQRELEQVWLCDHVVTVSHAEADVIRSATASSVSVMGIRQESKPGGTPFAGRSGLLHVGTLVSNTSPNYDGLKWFVGEVLPILRTLVGAERGQLTVAGTLSADIDLSWLDDAAGVTMLGPVSELAPLFDRHSVFIAPTRFAAGIPVKVLEAAGHGIPIVCTDLLGRQLGWTDNVQARCVSGTDAAAFAAAIAALMGDEETWTRTREAALQAVADQASPAGFTSQLEEIFAAVGTQTFTVNAVEGPAALRSAPPAAGLAGPSVTGSAASVVPCAACSPAASLAASVTASVIGVRRASPDLCQDLGAVGSLRAPEDGRGLAEPQSEPAALLGASRAELPAPPRVVDVPTRRRGRRSA